MAAIRNAPRRRQARIAFDSLSIEGGLLSPDWLARIAQLDAGSQSPADYRIHKGLQLRDEIGRFWRIAQAHWHDFAAGRGHTEDPKALSLRFVTGLLTDAFGFTLAEPAPQTDAARPFPIDRFALSGTVPLVVAPAGRRLDDHDPAFGDGLRRRSPFGLVQEFLNATDGALWGLVSNGASLRLVRDNASLTRPAWIEADLERMFGEERFSDFAALWLLAHETRLGRDGVVPSDCVLEAWLKAGRDEGTRARDQLRAGVEQALLALGQGFVAHPDNHELRAALESGALTREAYFQQLLRLVYRFIFLLTVEERGLLHPEGTPEPVRRLYAEGYGLRRLRDRAVRRSSHDRFGDLWDAVRIVFRATAHGEPRLGLPALAGLFAPDLCAALEQSRLENRALLTAMFHLSWLREPTGLSRVNWRDMGPEELGSVYEGLLELVPQVSLVERRFFFADGDETRGHARKLTGSYYTPDSLVQVLLDTALEPVVQRTLAAHPQDPAEALLRLSVVDPACGSGHFLLAAARRLAAHVARLRAGGTPTPPEYRTALRQVIGRCIFGVDLNPMAVELCKVALWMEALEPGKPLSFLDSHVQHGNALLGATPQLMETGVPDDAWVALEGDDRRTTSALKRRNKDEAAGQRQLDFGVKPDDSEQQVRSAVKALDAKSDDDAQALATKQAEWAHIQTSEAYRRQRLTADAWCAAFVWPKPAVSADTQAIIDAAPTNGVWRQIRDGQARTLTIETTEKLREQYRFFHWHLAFPQVFDRGGFDVVLGNPPWERIKIQEQEFFATRDGAIAKAENKAAREKLIKALPSTNPRLWRDWCEASRTAQGESHLARKSGRYPLCGKGDVNTYALFAEHNRSVLGSKGRAGFIVPTGIVTDENTSAFIRSLVAERSFQQIISFENEGVTFGGVNNRQSFCLLSISREPVKRTRLQFNVNQPLPDNAGPLDFELAPDEFLLFNPNSGTSPTFRTRRDAEINKEMYRRAGVLWREDDEEHGNPWGIRFMAMLHMANDSKLFRSMQELQQEGLRFDGLRFVGDGREFLPLIEAKMLQAFDHRSGTYEGATQAHYNKGFLPKLSDEAHTDPWKFALADAWVDRSEVETALEGRWTRGWFIGWRDISRRTDVRTVTPTILPRVAVGHTTPLLFPSAPPANAAALYANLASFALDYAARQKVGGTHLTYAYLKQFPVLPPSTYQAETPWARGTTLVDWMLPRVLELTYTAWDLEPFARDVGWDGPPFRWDPERRALLRAELDAAFFHLYGLSREDADYVMETFPIVRRHDEKAHGEYRTKRLVLEAYDAMADAQRSGHTFRSRLQPAPADPAVAHPARVGGRG